MLPDSIERLINELAKLPTIGRKSSQRLVLHLLRKQQSDLDELANAVSQLKENLRYCNKCYNYSERDLCNICDASNRDPDLICVVEDVLDILAIETSGEYRGLYHVLHGKLSPLDGVGPSDLKIFELKERIKSEDNVGFCEIILATSTSMEGEATASYIAEQLRELPVKVSRISQGIPIGGDLDYADTLTLRRALQGRQNY